MERLDDYVRRRITKTYQRKLSLVLISKAMMRGVFKDTAEDEQNLRDILEAAREQKSDELGRHVLKRIDEALKIKIETRVTDLLQRTGIDDTDLESEA